MLVQSPVRLYRFEASFDYDPSPALEKISAPLLAILFADDELNPPELGVIEREMAKVRGGRYVMVPSGPRSEAHRTQVQATIWSEALLAFLSGVPAPPR